MFQIHIRNNAIISELLHLCFNSLLRDPSLPFSAVGSERRSEVPSILSESVNRCHWRRDRRDINEIPFFSHSVRPIEFIRQIVRLVRMGHGRARALYDDSYRTLVWAIDGLTLLFLFSATALTLQQNLGKCNFFVK